MVALGKGVAAAAGVVAVACLNLGMAFVVLLDYNAACKDYVDNFVNLAFLAELTV